MFEYESGRPQEHVRLAAYRIAEEALTNVAKHTKATKVNIKLRLLPEEWLCMILWDDGQGFDLASASGGRGLMMMQDYAEVVGGRCIIKSAPGEGTEVTALLPFSGPGAKRLEKSLTLEQMLASPLLPPASYGHAPGNQ